MERVSVITGKTPVIFVCPYGADRPVLATLAEQVAYYSEGNSIINRGFKKGPQVNYDAEIADLNRIDHCLLENVLFEEFMLPIVKLKQKLKKKHKRVNVFVLTDLPSPGPKDMDFLIGYGNGENFTATCPLWAVELYATALKYVEFKPYLANPKGIFTASDPKVMNQLFRVYDYEKEAISMHLWVNDHMLKYTKSTASGIADAAVEMTKHKTYTSKPLRLPLY